MEAARASLEDVRQLLVLQVTERYYALLRARRLRDLAQERRVGEEPELVEVGGGALPRREDEVAVDLGGRDDAPCEVVAHGWVA